MLGFTNFIPDQNFRCAKLNYSTKILSSDVPQNLLHFSNNLNFANPYLSNATDPTATMLTNCPFICYHLLTIH